MPRLWYRWSEIVASMSALSVTISISLAHGQPTDTRSNSRKALELARRAKSLGSSGNYLQAIVLFKQAAVLDNRAEYQCNIGVAYYELENWPRADLFLTRCMARSAGVDKNHVLAMNKIHDYVRNKLRTGTFALVNIDTSPAGALIHASPFGKDETIPNPGIAWLPLGAHTLIVSAVDHETKTLPLTLSDNKQVFVQVSLKKRSATPPLPTRVTKQKKPVKTAAWIVAGLAGASLVGGVTFHALAINSRNELADLTIPEARAKKNDQLERRRLAMFAFYGTAAAAAGIATYLFLRKPNPPRTVSIYPTTRSPGAMVQLHWTY